MLRFAFLLVALSVALLGRSAQAAQPAPVVVRLESSRSGVELLRRDARGAETTVCAAPCDIAVASQPEDRFFVDGPDVPRSAAFALERPGPLRVEVDAGDSSDRVLGGLTIGLGAGTAAAGTIALLVQIFAPTIHMGPNGHFVRDEAPLAVGVSCLVSGALVGSLGIFFMATSGTRVTVESKRSALSSPIAFGF